MSKILTVFGATGQQGSSVVSHVLNDPELSKEYKIRAITRDVNSEKAKQLKEKVDVVQGDISDRASLEKALAGTHTVFAMTTPSFAPDGYEVEYNSGKTMIDVSVEQGAQYIIFSTLPDVRGISSGKYNKVYMWDVKAALEKYIQGLPISSAFVSPGFFLENFHTPMWSPRKAPDGTFVLTQSFPGSTKLPWFAVVPDLGKFVGSILAEPKKYEGKRLCAAEGFYSMDGLAQIISRESGKSVVFHQIADEDFRKVFPLADVFIDCGKYIEEFGHYGPGGEEAVKWAVENARGKLMTPEEYFSKVAPLKLE